LLMTSRRELPCILIAPPSGMLNFPPLQGYPVWSVVGSQDQFCDKAALNSVLDSGRLTVIPGVDHFWFGREQSLVDYLAQMLPLL
jgi:hypothetical protein